MARFVEVSVEPISAEAFAPFGQLIAKRNGQPAFFGDGLRAWRLDCDITGTTELLFVQYDYRPMVFSKIERHFTITQCFIPLDGAAMVMVVAPLTDPSDRSALPPPASVRAFLVGGDMGILLLKGVWHALNRFPVHRAAASFALITSTETQRELERQLNQGSEPELTQAVDYEQRFGVSFRIADPHRLLPAPT
jgi:ureidoglycolate lyase